MGLVIGWSVLSVYPTNRLTAQSVLDQFSYDNLQPTGLRFELGALGASRLRGALVGGLRFDAGNIAVPFRNRGPIWTRDRSDGLFPSRSYLA